MPMTAATSIINNGQDKDWIGGLDKFNTTEGNDFWLTYMSNDMFDPSLPENANVKFEMKVMVSAREAMQVVVEAGGTLITADIGAGQTRIIEIPRRAANDIYLLHSEEAGKRGVHVYAAQKDAKKAFSCFLYSRVQESPVTSRDASLVIPTCHLGKEYIIQTYPEDVYSSQFAIVATEDNTTVYITPTMDSDGSLTGGVTSPAITLSKGQAYLVASKRRDEGTTGFAADLSGSKICADKPIAVFNGNQQTGIPNKEGYSQDFMVEQTIPVDQWGTEYYLSTLANTKRNYIYVTAAENGTLVEVTMRDTLGATTVSTPMPLNQGQTLIPIQMDDETTQIRIRSVNSDLSTSDKKIACFVYTSTAAVNEICTRVGFTKECYIYGDPANAMMPSWNRHRTTAMNFYTDRLDPQGGDAIPQHFYVYLVARSADVRKIFLKGLNGTNTALDSYFRPFGMNSAMAYAHVELPGNQTYHELFSTGDCEGFVGMVYGLTEAQSYFYTLGFTPPHPADSMYVTNTQEVVMSNASYHVDSLDYHGWYQRQEKEWTQLRLDTAVVCDSSWVNWAVETPTERPITQIQWLLYDVTDVHGARHGTMVDGFPVSGTAAGDVHTLRHQFILPEEDAEDRHQFFEYELQAILYRDRIFCTDDDIDTLKTTVRVTRVYNDTLFRVLCVGDTLRFFYDSLYNQSDLTKYRHDSASTKFVGVKQGEGDRYLKEWHYQLEVGKYDTLSRHYLTQAGCDSTMTLVVYVCDTFQFFDTIHLCHNKQIEYHGQIIRGSQYRDHDTIDIKRRFYRDDCACQHDPDFGKFRDKNGKTFRGCDSTYYLHLYIHPNYLIPLRDTLCLDRNGKGAYSWTVGDHTRVIHENELQWSAADQALKGVFRDTLQTTDCPDCTGGGCDSIIELTLIMPQSYYFPVQEEEWCMLHYDWNRHDTVHSYFRWTGHRDGDPYVELRESGTYYDSCQTTRYGCDSIYTLQLTYKSAGKELYVLQTDTVCFDSTALYNWTNEKGQIIEQVPLNVRIPKSARCTTLYRSLEAGCDTIYALHLTILPKYYIVDPILITQEEVYTWPVNGVTYGGSKATEPHDVTITEDTTYVVVRHTTEPVGTHFCDSIRVLFLRVGSVYRVDTSSYACGNDTRFEWIEDRPEYFGTHSGPFSRLVIPASQLPAPGQTKTYEDPYQTVLGFDSIFYLHLYRAPSYRDTTHVEDCQQRLAGAQHKWAGHESRQIYNQWGDPMPYIPLNYDGDFYYLDTMHTEGYDCDSLCVLHLHVHPYFDKYKDWHVCQFEPFAWEDLPGNTRPDSIMDQDGRKLTGPIPTNHTGTYTYTLRFHTIHDCDSSWHLTLHVDTVYLTPVETTPRTMCDDEAIPFLDGMIYGVNCPYKPEGEPGVSVPEGAHWYTFNRQGTMAGSNGCDSAVLHQITLYRTYYFPESDQICQGTTYTWHGLEIPTDVEAGTYTYRDPKDKSQFGCDSIHELTLRIDSVYRFDQPRLLCDYDTVSWQGHHYRGERFVGDAPGYRLVKADTTYLDTAAYTSKHGCDSIYYLTLRVAPSYNHTIEYNVCDNDSSIEAHVYEFRDTYGTVVYSDTLEFSATPKDMPGVRKDTMLRVLSHTLQTYEGCDSVVTYQVVIHPTYRFVDSDKGCAGFAIEWRGETISGTGTYYDRLLTDQWECDSVYELDFYVKPFKSISIYDQVCENHTYWHRDTVGETVFSEDVWHPGAYRPDPEKGEHINVHFKGADGCDSIVYQYYLDICRVYIHDAETDGICSGDTFYSAELDHAWGKFAYEFDTDTFVLPYDTVFRDTLSTVRGCDSIYNLYAHVFPAYRHIDHDTICSNGTYVWAARDARPDSLLTELEPGLHYLRDSFLTLDGCDSIYEMQLIVNTAYLEVDSIKLCADETLFWHGFYYEHMTPGEYFEQISQLSIHGCDSIHQLYLFVKDTTNQFDTATICIGDSLYVLEHLYMEAGDYKDTTLNEDGCHHFIYTHINVIPPTVPTVWAEDPMCPSETAFDLYYTYTSADPISYSLYFDSVGQSMGFEDMIDVPITEYSNPMVISVPIPYRDGNRTQYPRPNDYNVHLVLDNGICQHPEADCFVDSTFTMNYPKWLTEQRFGDVIALLNEHFNGGYVWTSYQWYLGDSMLVGQTLPYLYEPMGLHVGEQYHVVLTREGEEVAFPTCPITIVTNPVPDDKAPTMGYLSVTPTYIVSGNPRVHILSRKDGTYRVTSGGSGQLVTQGVFRADVTEVVLPAVPGVYIFQLWSSDTPEEPYRCIKVIMGN